MSATATSRPLSGVRVFLHIRQGPGNEDSERRNHSRRSVDHATERNRYGSRASARDILRTARVHVQQLGATLALSEAAADLVVFHRGSASFLEAAHVKFKTVVSPDYLAACVAADQRVSIAPYVVTPTPTATAAMCTTPAHKSSDFLSSAAHSSHASAASLGYACSATTATDGTPSSSGGVTKSIGSATHCAVEAPSRATRSPLKSGTQMNTLSKDSTRPPVFHGLLLLDDEDEDDGKADSQQCRGATPARGVTVSDEDSATSSGATESHRRLSSISNRKANAMLCAAGQFQGDGADSQQGRSETHAKRSAHLASTVAFELDEDITQQPSSGTASTPQLTPSSRYDTGCRGGHGVNVVALPSSCRNERVAASVKTGEAAMEEEDAIRHAVLRSTATATVTRRRGRPHKHASSAPKEAYTVSSLADSVASDRGATATRSRDPFLNGEGSSQHQLLPQAAPAPSLSEANVAVTQSLAESSLRAPTAAAQPQMPSAMSAAPTRTTVKRPRSSNGADSCTEKPVLHTRAKPSDKPQRRRQSRRKQEDVGCSAVQEVRKPRKQKQQQQRQLCAQRHRRVSSRGRTSVLPDLECTPVSEVPVSMTFTDLTFLRQLAWEDEKDRAAVARLCVLVFLDGLADVDAAAVALSYFLRDVVEQLGATCVILGNGAGDDSGDGWCWFSRHKRAHVERAPRIAKKPTHLVVSSHAVLTPDVLYYKALGIPIVTPQWLYDAIALGAFPVVLPHVHAHPVYGDRQVADAGVAAAVPLTAVSVPYRGELLGAEEGDGDAVEKKAVRAGATPGVRCLPRCGVSSILRQLRKEVADEYVPAAEQAMRPFYVPIFQDRMFYLHVPPVDLANANATGGGAGPLRSGRASRNDCSENYLGDATAALAQVKELLRVLGGTVTRNVESTYLDLVIDLTGFYDNVVEVGLTAREQQSQQQQTRTLRESLSCAFQEALQRVSMQSVSMDAEAALAAPAASPTAPPVVGIAWLIHSILTRQWTATDSFILTEHPLAKHISAARPQAQVDGTVTTGVTMSHKHTTGSGVVAAPVVEGARVAAGAPAAKKTPYTPPAPPSHEEAAESLSSSVWSALVAAAAAPQLKRTRGPQASLKHAGHQLGTQEIARILSDAQLQSLSVPDAATPSTPESAHPPHQSATTSLCMEEEENLSFGRRQCSDGDYDDVV
ncbi:hypothetical protein, conserved [Leishmania tarentolae]|uniref:BRCT domain-containing protein n=1 Tax=Leishmania tarentolae TaxID=5689 RepID=A0A640KI76_LEITA|nr:hypothetical protein, conserved [Leishmania tarentolae]